MSRQGSVSLHSLDSPPSQTRLAYPLVRASSSMHDPHAAALADFQSQRYSVGPYVVPSAAASPPRDYAMSPMSAHAGGHTVGAVRTKRKQVKNACSACQRACKRCDIGRPCERCIKYGMQDTCRDSVRKERKKGVKRGPYKKRDGELAVPAPQSVADVAPPGMLNELQRMTMPTKTRTSRVSSISEPPSQASTSASVSQMDQSASAAAVPLYIQSVPSARPSEGPFPYSTAVMIPASTQHPSLASMHPSSSHASMHHSTRGEDQYYQPRYDLAHGSARSGHFRMDSYPAQQDYQTKQVVAGHRSVRLQYPSPEGSPPRERQYSTQMYSDNPHRHAMIQTSPTHHDVSYQPQSEPAHNSPRTIDAQYSYAGQQQRSYERTYQERSYPSEGHMQDAHAQEIQSQYYSSYNAYQNPSSSYAPHSYGYSQNHAPHAMGPAQQASDQPDAGYVNRADQVSYGSINSYPTQQQSYPPQHSAHMSGSVEYAMRSAGRLMHRDMATHPHVGNVQIQTN
ncbi:hypothetical protein FRC10_007696 [Ceratobasidium sp. 414]|nr:hypothetical protein FRC10_007696 [Ceratobasidium sp. 414]